MPRLRALLPVLLQLFVIRFPCASQVMMKNCLAMTGSVVSTFYVAESLLSFPFLTAALALFFSCLAYLCAGPLAERRDAADRARGKIAALETCAPPQEASYLSERMKKPCCDGTLGLLTWEHVIRDFSAGRWQWPGGRTLPAVTKVLALHGGASSPPLRRPCYSASYVHVSRPRSRTSERAACLCGCRAHSASCQHSGEGLRAGLRAAGHGRVPHAPHAQPLPPPR